MIDRETEKSREKERSDRLTSVKRVMNEVSARVLRATGLRTAFHTVVRNIVSVGRLFEFSPVWSR